jgi:preprotein translocase subunit SecB
MSLDPLAVSLRSCRLLDFNLSTPDLSKLNKSENVNLELKYDFSISESEDNIRSARCKLSLRPSEGLFYSIDMVVVAVFEFPENSSPSEVEEYLQTYGSSRVYDYSRILLEQETASGFFGAVRIPPVPPSTD